MPWRYALPGYTALCCRGPTAARYRPNGKFLLRIRPWQVNEMRVALRTHPVTWLIAEAERTGAPRVISINTSGSFGEKERDPRYPEPVDWFFDHSESTQTQLATKTASVR